MTKRLRLAALLLLALAARPAAATTMPVPAPADVVPNFRLLDHRGESHELRRLAGHRAVVLLVAGVGCPLVRHSLPELRRVRDEFSPRGVAFALLDPNAHDARDEVAAEARDFGIDFPVLLDPAQGVARALGIHHTAEAIVIETAAWTVAWRGPVDDRVGYGTQRPAAAHRWLADALAAFLGGKPVPPAGSEAKGCAVAYDEPASVDYARDVAPLIAAKCAGCHGEGNVAPFAFDRHARVKGRAATIREALLDDRMPPWHADPHDGAFANDRSLTPAQKRLLFAWIARGAPRGGGEDPLATARPAAAGDWPLGRPDAVVALPEPARIPATGLVPYHVQVARSPFTNDAWVRGVVVRPGNAQAVHHCLVFIRYPEALRHLEPRQDEGMSGFFAGYVPGSDPGFFPGGSAKFVPRGSELVFQMHYTTTGREETDRTELGLYLAPGKPAAELVTGACATTDIGIPPGARAHPARAEFVFDADSVLHEMSPHMHLRGSSFSYAAVYPDGREETLLRVPRYDFNWQTLYRLKEPKRMPAGTRLVCRGTFDNSASNPANPDPAATVHFGEQTADEMFIGYFNYTRAAGP